MRRPTTVFPPQPVIRSAIVPDLLIPAQTPASAPPTFDTVPPIPVSAPAPFDTVPPIPVSAPAPFDTVPPSFEDVSGEIDEDDSVAPTRSRRSRVFSAVLSGVLAVTTLIVAGYPALKLGFEVFPEIMKESGTHPVSTGFGWFMGILGGVSLIMGIFVSPKLAYDEDTVADGYLNATFLPIVFILIAVGTLFASGVAFVF